MTKDPGDKRLFPRHPLHKIVRVEVDGEIYEGETTDISLGGVSVTATTHLSNDAFVNMHIDTIGEMTGHVVRSTDDGFAVRFDPVKEEKDRLEAHLKSMFKKD
ncbi:MAG: PilZ domain-containing protein [Rhodospirillales bacterium]|nr:PilZ domain-containing protein [Rhodospirillales bacterium]